MSLTNVRLILAREIRDQLRDRRTMFMIFVLPVLLYPLLGVSLSQMVQFRKERPARVRVVGAEASMEPPLFEGEAFSPRLLSDPRRGADCVELRFRAERPEGESKSVADEREEARRDVQAGRYDAALVFPPDFAKQLEAFRRAIRAQSRADRDHGIARGRNASLRMPCPTIVYTTAKDCSKNAFFLLSGVLDRWTDEVGKTNLVAGGVPASAARPFDVQTADVAEKTAYHGAAIWSKILPMLLLVWAMTGAFYPAVDLCAGEKERGTLETLLSSPAGRSDIVLGKLLTVMLFSMVTSGLNLLSVGVTGCLIFGHLPTFGPPSPLAVLWLAIALVPVSALFRRMCLALAALARSTKEGQYYLMPLLLVTLPLAIGPMTGGVELTPANSLIPITGIVLLLRSVLEGAYWPALQCLPIVAAVTLAACWLAVRWAVEQFNSESVLFREGERFHVGLWLRHLVRDRQATPTATAALFCGIAILMVKFVLESAVVRPPGFGGFAGLAVMEELLAVLAPALLMALFLTGKPRETLSVRLPRWQAVPAAAVLAVAIHPVAMALQSIIQQLYPIGGEMQKALEETQAMLAAADIWQVVLVLALIPAICEELAFRGFILSGFRSVGCKRRAILWSAILFGLVHGVLQQSLAACALGLVLGYVVVQSGSILPAIVFHFLHNTLVVGASRLSPEVLDRWPLLGVLVRVSKEGELAYPWQVWVLGTLTAAVVLAWFARLPSAKPPEDTVHEAIDHAPDGPAECCVTYGE